MEIVYVVIGLMILLIIKGIYDEKRNKRILMHQLREEWGKVPEEEYSESKMQSLRGYYNDHIDADRDVDDVTWNDINMDEVFMLINNTGSSIGEEFLYALLRKPSFNPEDLRERSRLINYFTKNHEQREQLQFMIKQFGKLDKISLYEYINRTNDFDVKYPYLHYIYAISFIGAVLSFFISPQLGAILTLVSLVNNIITYNKTKAKIEIYFNVFSYILKIVNGVEEISNTKLDGIEDYMDSLKSGAKKFRSFKKGASLVVTNGTIQDGLSQLILDYFRMLFHIDIIKFNSMLKQLRANRAVLNEMYETIGFLDSMIAVASFRELMGAYCEPKLVDTKQPILEAEEIYHPLISNPVKNSLRENKNILLTGSNASGKSTFLKTLAINAILAQTIYTCLAKEYRGSYYKILSSMALQDNIFSSESYYMVEIKSLKRILDQVKDDVPVLCFVDEVLRGTNTLERIAASAEILHSFTKHRVLCVAATHDNELTYILENEFHNYHFQEEIVDNDVIFDYRLYKGRAVSKNAIQLLGIIGYDRNIIDAAMKRANTFLDTGEWRVFPS